MASKEENTSSDAEAMSKYIQNFLQGAVSVEDVLHHPTLPTLLKLIQEQAQDPRFAASPETSPPNVGIDNILSTLMSGVIMLDSESYCRYANQAAADILQVQLTDLLETRFDLLDIQAFDDTGQAQTLPCITALESQKSVSYVELEIKSPANNFKVWLSINAAPLFDATDNFQGVVSSFQDITAYKEANLALRQSEAYLRATLNNDNQSFLLLDLQHRVLMQNKSAHLNNLRVFQASPKQGQSILNGFVLPRDRESFLRNFQTAAQGQQVIVEKAFSTSNGEVNYFEIRYNPITTEDGEVWAVSLTSLNITDRKKDIESIRILSKVFQNAADPIILKDLQGNITDINHAVEEKYGWERSDLLGISVNKLIPPEHQRRSAIMIQRCIQGEIVRNFETVRLTKYGARCTVLLTLVLLQDDLGQAVGIASMGKDITALKKAQLAQQTALEQAETLQQAALSLGMATDLNQVLELILNELQKVVPYDSASVQVLKDDHFEIIAGRGFNNWPAINGLKVPIGGLPSKSQIVDGAFVILDDAQHIPHFKDQSEYGIRSWMGIPLKFGQKVIGKLGIDKAEPGFFNIEHAELTLAFGAQAAVALENARLLNEAIENRRQAEAANKTKTRFLASMSHELRTPLNGILGYTQLLKQDLTLLAKHRQAIETIHRSSEHLLAMINDLLDLSRIDGGRIQLKTAPFDLINLLEHIKQVASLPAKEKGVALHLILSPLLPQFVQGDEGRLQQVLLNLLSIAIKLTPSGQVIVRAETNDSGISFHTFDTGPGTPLNNEESEVNLHLTQELIARMGGHLEVEHILHKGSHFWFNLPLQALPSAQSRISQHQRYLKAYASDQQSPKQIWLIGQWSLTYEMINNWLTQLKFEVLHFSQAEAVTHTPNKPPPTIAIIELTPPHLQGLETLSTLRNLSQWKDSIIITLASQSNSELTAQCWELGADEQLVKPILFDEVLHLLQKHLKLSWLSTAELPAAPQQSQGQTSLSSESLEKLIDLLEKGDILEMQSELTDQLQGETTAFTEKVRHLLDSFELDALEILLKTRQEELRQASNQPPTTS